MIIHPCLYLDKDFKYAYIPNSDNTRMVEHNLTHRTRKPLSIRHGDVLQIHDGLIVTISARPNIIHAERLPYSGELTVASLKKNKSMVCVKLRSLLDNVNEGVEREEMKPINVVVMKSVKKIEEG